MKIKGEKHISSLVFCLSSFFLFKLDMSWVTETQLLFLESRLTRTTVQDHEQEPLHQNYVPPREADGDFKLAANGGRSHSSHRISTISARHSSWSWKFRAEVLQKVLFSHVPQNTNSAWRKSNKEQKLQLKDERAAGPYQNEESSRNAS